jgi:hypothetical protein
MKLNPTRKFGKPITIYVRQFIPHLISSLNVNRQFILHYGLTNRPRLEQLPNLEELSL